LNSFHPPNVFNRGLKTLTKGEAYLKIVQDELLPKVQPFQPDILVILNGVDPHQGDPVVGNYLSRAIELNDNDFAQLIEILIDFSKCVCYGKIIVLGAGGYNSEITSKIWFQTLQLLHKHV
jgi:acetoin utilization deacetylase AcuC-like enzyme